MGELDHQPPCSWIKKPPSVFQWSFRWKVVLKIKRWTFLGISSGVGMGIVKVLTVLLLLSILLIGSVL